MYRFVSLVFAAFLCVSCFSNGNKVDVNSDLESDYTVIDEDQEEFPDGDTDTENPDTDTSDTVSDGDTDTENPETDTGDTVPDGDTGDTDTGDTGDTGDTVPDCDPDVSDCEVHIRIVAGNITSSKKNVCSQCYDPGEGIRIFQALKPDIALVQEMNYGNNSTSDYKQFAQKIVGTDYYAVDDDDYQIPNGVVSKYPITSHGYWKDPNITNRALMWAVVDIPGNTDIFAISVHLKTDDGGKQNAAAKVIVDEIAKVKANNPGKYYYVVGGDFNGTSAVSSSGFGRNNTFYVAGPHPVDDNGNSNTNSGREKQYDFVLADYPLHGFQVSTVYYSSEDSTKIKSYENGLVFDTRLYSQSVLDEYFSPAQQNDSGASSMQHMAVVKDFLIELR